ncbi:phosphotriesterase family protein, partial [Streptomyces clavuligerus]|uniref:phosphotriesterase family protein n=1 Tax=Streptomyces clavuligerus TaxID=1901 RepID=UPI001E581C95
APPAPPQVRTVTGPLPGHAVTGPVLAHEHLALDLDRTGEGAAVLDARHAPAVAAELAGLREEYGLGLVVEPTCRGMGRDPAALRRISRASGVAVVAATGWYYEPFHTPEVNGAGVEELADVLIREITTGITTGAAAGITTGAAAGAVPAAAGTGAGPVLPGIIGEVGSHGETPSEPETRVLRAAARAALATGLAVATHAHLGRGGPAQLALLTREGLPPDRVSIGHQDLLDSPAVHRELAATGAYVAFDTVGKEDYGSDTTRLRLLLALLEAGHADRALLSGDISRHRYLWSEGGQGYGHLFRVFLPRLRAAGADDALIDLLTRRNPLRLLTGARREQRARHQIAQRVDEGEARDRV